MKELEKNAYYGSGFAGFNNGFKDAFEPEDFEIIRIFAPVAEMMMKKKLPEMITKQNAEKHPEASQLKSQAKSTGYVPKDVLALKGRKDISFEETIGASRFIINQVSPILGMKTDEIVWGKRVQTSEINDAEYYGTCLREKENMIQEKCDEFERNDKTLRAGKIHEHLVSYLNNRQNLLKKQIIEHQQEIQNIKYMLQTSQKLPKSTSYLPALDDMYINLNYDIEDITDLAHEGGHAATRGCNRDRISEVPSIASEFFVDNYMASEGVGTVYRAADRVYSMQNQAPHIIALNNIFSECMSTGNISYENVEKALRFAGERTEAKAADDYTSDDLKHFHNLLRTAKYFVGSASALVMQNYDNSSVALQELFRLMNDGRYSDTQILHYFGITTKTVTNALTDFVAKNRTDTKGQTQVSEVSGDDRR